MMLPERIEPKLESNEKRPKKRLTSWLIVTLFANCQKRNEIAVVPQSSEII